MYVNLIMETSQINKGDRYILSMMKNPAPIEVMEKPTKITNPLCCFSSNVIESKETAFEIYKKIQMCEMIDLFEFWKSQSKGKLSQISEVAIKILSIMCTSASVEREFSTISYTNISCTTCIM